MKNKLLRGIPASPGIVITKAILYTEEKPFIRYTVPPAGRLPVRARTQTGRAGAKVGASRPGETIHPTDEATKLRLAIQRTKEETYRLKENFLRKTDFQHARIFDVQLLALEDKTLINTTLNLITRGDPANVAFKKAVTEILHKIGKIKDAYIKERIKDIKDISDRILRNLGTEPANIAKLIQIPHAIVSQDLTPSDTSALPEQVVGFATDLGNKTSHTAIMAQALEIPAVVGLREVTNSISSGDDIIIDGNRGIVIIEPDASTRRTYEKNLKRFKKYEEELSALATLPSETLDGYPIELSCNIEIPEEIETGIAYGAAGIGLMRTEFFYLAGKKPPTESEQFKIYDMIAKKVHPYPVIIRTFDIGGDKLNSSFVEQNPFLGCRGIRYSLLEKKLFGLQLKAILRASKRGNVKILLPMVGSQKELIETKALIESIKTELDKKNIAYDKNIEIGAMIEIPSTALITGPIVQEADFLSIGSNDLTQYILACDRINPGVVPFYDPFHPAIFRLIKSIIQTAHKARKWVGCCGELSAEPLAIPILLGLEVDELSVAPISLLKVKKIIRALSKEEAKTLANKICLLETPGEIAAFMEIEKEKFSVLKDVLTEYK